MGVLGPGHSLARPPLSPTTPSFLRTLRQAEIEAPEDSVRRSVSSQIPREPEDTAFVRPVKIYEAPSERRPGLTEAASQRARLIFDFHLIIFFLPLSTQSPEWQTKGKRWGMGPPDSGVG